MVKTLILTHGPLGDVLLRSAQTIAGDNGALAALCLDWGDPPEIARRKLAEAIERLGGEDGVLILTDMYGGTPHNVATELREGGRVEVVSGVNLPMVLRLDCGSSGNLSLAELADWIRDKGRRAICAGGARRTEPSGVGKTDRRDG